ncbi:hypothetical protein PCAR4_40159 [Paraburkholderia caribensis]|nr:hypothetical protein PCAR4_40159 [Paraburkholderia caribensis]
MDRGRSTRARAWLWRPDGHRGRRDRRAGSAAHHVEADVKAALFDWSIAIVFGVLLAYAAVQGWSS